MHKELFMQKVIIVSGYFNPLHKGHIEYFNMAKACGDQLFVIVNNDYQRVLKGSKAFMKEDERVYIVKNLKWSTKRLSLSIKIELSVRHFDGY